MSSLDPKNDFDRISRPRNGMVNSATDFPFQVQRTPKKEFFALLQEQIAKALEKNETIDPRAMEHFFNEVTGKSTTPEELRLAVNVAKNLAEHPQVLDEASQIKFLDIPQKIAIHRNADFTFVRESKDILSLLSKNFPRLTAEEAQRKFFDNVTFLVAPQKDGEWKVDLLNNIAVATENGMDDIADVAQSPYINLMGKTASLLPSLDSETQGHYQGMAIELMRKTKFPYKFDADALREALFVVPDSVRTEEYNTQLQKFVANLTPKSPKEPASGIIPDVHPSVPYEISEEEKEEDLAPAKADVEDY
ncbi:MAG: hypothetical protein LBN94_00285 [Puniceicoccales bacterium]|jgi:hypothetical protein|nr:hypothetical protein [Puniceicoccales bacterium]